MTNAVLYAWIMNTKTPTPATDWDWLIAEGPLTKAVHDNWLAMQAEARREAAAREALYAAHRAIPRVSYYHGPRHYPTAV
jgi:hypothetical protein